MNIKSNRGVSRRDALHSAGVLAGATFFAGMTGAEKVSAQAAKGATSDEEYVWLSANANLPTFVAHDPSGSPVGRRRTGSKSHDCRPEQRRHSRTG